jgi:N-acetyl-gamma-glutamyl-phosphate reductase
MPAGQAASAIADTLAQELPESVRIIDLSGDFRLSDPDTHRRYYPEVPLAPEVRAACVYALPEITPHHTIAAARYLTNPGCLSTTAIMALAPVRDLTCIGPIVIDAKTGTSGAGREPQASMHHPSRAHDFTAYKVLEHRHEPEILQALGLQFQSRNSVMFVPHLLPVSRGIMVSCYLSLADSAVAAAIPARYRDMYSSSPFVRVRTRPPRLVDVVGTNFCDIQIVVRGSQVVILAATDNLGKGMAGQCIQNLNIIFGLPQETGLLFASPGPV